MKKMLKRNMKDEIIVIFVLANLQEIVSLRRRSYEVTKKLYEGTKWCGDINEEDNYIHELNDTSSAKIFGCYEHLDKCCLFHYHCPRYMNARTKKFGVVNKSKFKIKDCLCDNDLKMCLADVYLQSGRKEQNAAMLLANDYFQETRQCLRFSKGVQDEKNIKPPKFKKLTKFVPPMIIGRLKKRIF